MMGFDTVSVSVMGFDTVSRPSGVLFCFWNGTLYFHVMDGKDLDDGSKKNAFAWGLFRWDGF